MMQPTTYWCTTAVLFQDGVDWGQSLTLTVCCAVPGDDIFLAEPNVVAAPCARARHDLCGWAMGDWLRSEMDSAKERQR